MKVLVTSIAPMGLTPLDTVFNKLACEKMDLPHSPKAIIQLRHFLAEENRRTHINRVTIVSELPIPKDAADTAFH